MKKLLIILFTVLLLVGCETTDGVIVYRTYPDYYWYNTPYRPYYYAPPPRYRRPLPPPRRLPPVINNRRFGGRR